MAPSSPIARLVDIVDAIEPIRTEIAGVTLAAFAADRRRRWLVGAELKSSPKPAGTCLTS